MAFTGVSDTFPQPWAGGPVNGAAPAPAPASVPMNSGLAAHSPAQDPSWSDISVSGSSAASPGFVSPDQQTPGSGAMAGAVSGGPDASMPVCYCALVPLWPVAAAPIRAYDVPSSGAVMP